MNWSMPRPVLQVVATALVVACLGAFALGALDRAGARPPARRAGGRRYRARCCRPQEATPLTDERIVGATQDRKS